MIATEAPVGATCDFCEEANPIIVRMSRISVCSDCVTKLAIETGVIAADAGLTMRGEVRAANPLTLFRHPADFPRGACR